MSELSRHAEALREDPIKELLVLMNWCLFRNGFNDLEVKWRQRKVTKEVRFVAVVRIRRQRVST